MTKNLEQLVTIGSLVLHMQGCSEYRLTAIDTGFRDENETLVTYDACNPQEWDIPPAGTERASCIGIEDAALQYTDELLYNGQNTFTTQLSLGNCTGGFEDASYDQDFGANMEMEAWYSSPDEFLGEPVTVSHGSGEIACYSSQEPAFSRFVHDIPISRRGGGSPFDEENGFVVEYNLWLLTDEEKNINYNGSNEEWEELLASIEPLKGVIDCTNAETPDNCTSLLYR